MEIPYISLHDFAAINDLMSMRVRHFDPNFWQWSSFKKTEKRVLTAVNEAAEI